MEFKYHLPTSLSFDNHLEFEKELLIVIGEQPVDHLILDAENTKYISSAGLRVLLTFKNKYGNVEVINTSTEVYDVFEMTGFTNIITVSKAFRKVSIEGCPCIGKGAHGAVYRLAPDTIVKVYYDEHTTLEDIKCERELSKKAFVMGLPTAIALDIVKVDDMYGTVFELLNASSCSKYINESQENIDHFIDKAVEILKKIHHIASTDGDLPDMKQCTYVYLDKVKEFFDEETYNKIKALIDSIPTTMTLLHGDFHLKNQLMVGQELMLIDMDTLSIGDPIFELASICNSYYEFARLDKRAVESFLDISVEKAEYIWKQLSRKYYSDLDDEQYNHMCNKIMVLGCMRALHFFRKRNYPRELFDHCLSDLKNALSLI